VRHRYDDVRASDYLAGWIDHLFFCATAPANAARTTRWHSRDGIYVLGPYAEAKERLEELMALYREGLQRPLHFFPRSSWTYVLGDGDLNKARNKWFSYWKPVSANASSRRTGSLCGVWKIRSIGTSRTCRFESSRP
jgi:exodeoxyribonuclease V gamma subunit